MTQATVPGYVYTVYTAEGCTVTAPGFPAFSVTCSPGMANSFTAPGDKVEISDPAATLVAVRTFNGALAALGLLGGGSLLPAGYTRLEYLESTGTQYINTGLPSSNQTEVRAVAMVAPYAGSILYHRLFGSEASGDVPRLSLTLTVYETRVSFGSRFGSASRTFNIGITNADLEASAFEYFVSAASAGVVGKNEQTNVLDAEWQCEAQTQLFCWNSSSMKGRVYSFTMKEAGVQKLNLIPALDPTGAPCMFDTVSRKAFYNAGTGDFVTPPTGASTYSLRGRRVLPDWGKLTPTGLRRLYHVPEGYEGDILQYAAEHEFCPIEEEEPPAEGYWAPKWEEVAGVIYLRWVETAPPGDLANGKE